MFLLPERGTFRCRTCGSGSIWGVFPALNCSWPGSSWLQPGLMALHPTAASGRWFLVSHCDCAFSSATTDLCSRPFWCFWKTACLKCKCTAATALSWKITGHLCKELNLQPWKKQKQQFKQVYLGLKKQPDTWSLSGIFRSLPLSTSPLHMEPLCVGAYVLRCHFSSAQPLRISGDVTKCLLKAGKKAWRVGEPGKTRYKAPMAFEQQSFGHPSKARSLSSRYLAGSQSIQLKMSPAASLRNWH